MPRKPVVGAFFGRLFTFLPPTWASQLSEQTAIDYRPEPMTSSLNYPAYSPPLRKHIFSTENKQKKLPFSNPLPRPRAYVIYEWSPSDDIQGRMALLVTLFLVLVSLLLLYILCTFLHIMFVFNIQLLKTSKNTL